MNLVIEQCQEFYLKDSYTYLNAIKKYITDVNSKANLFERSGSVDFEAKGRNVRLCNHLKDRRPIYYSIDILEKGDDLLLFYNCLHINYLFFSAIIIISILSAIMNGVKVLISGMLLFVLISVLFTVVARVDLLKILKIIQSDNLKCIKKYKMKIIFE